MNSKSKKYVGLIEDVLAWSCNEVLCLYEATSGITLIKNLMYTNMKSY